MKTAIDSLIGKERIANDASEYGRESYRSVKAIAFWNVDLLRNHGGAVGCFLFARRYSSWVAGQLWDNRPDPGLPGSTWGNVPDHGQIMPQPKRGRGGLF